jgi:hypothetical protein
MALSLAATLGACATQHYKQTDKLTRTPTGADIVLMPVDVELFEISTGGVLTTNAEWTKKAEQLMVSGLKAEKEQRGLKYTEYVSPPENSPERLEQAQLLALHGAVGQSILIHQFVPQLALPSKNLKFDWSMGPSVRALRSGSGGARYGLFVYVRDSYVTAGRVAVIMFAALLGVSVPGGQQLGFASLVDLETGEIVWFNRLARGGGDLRSAEPAAETIRLLLDGLPQ